MKQVSYTELNDLTGFGQRTIKKRFDAAGLKPAGAFRGANLWDSTLALRAIYLPENSGSERLDGQQEKALLDKAKREAQELKNEEAKRHLAPVEVTGRIIADIAINARTKVLGIPVKVAAIVPEDIRIDVVKEVTKLVNEILSDLAAYIPAIEEEEG